MQYYTKVNLEDDSTNSRSNHILILYRVSCDFIALSISTQ